MRVWPSVMERWPTSECPNDWDIEMMLALADVEADVCSNCGGFLSKTTVHNHAYRVHTKGCLRCESLAKFTKDQAKLDETYDKLPQDAIDEMNTGDSPAWVRPEGRRLFIESIPLPDAE